MTYCRPPPFDILGGTCPPCLPRDLLHCLKGIGRGTKRQERRKVKGAYRSKIAKSYLPQSQLMPSLGVTPLEFQDEPDICKIAMLLRWYK